ncbi:MAG TPA: AarF/UbiB family protein [Polyangia bacterium]
MPAAREKTEELRLEDLAPAAPVGAPPPLPGPSSVVPPAAVSETPVPEVIADSASMGAATRARRVARRSESLRRPWRRLARAYTTTFLVVLSYLWLALRRRFVHPERLAVVTEEVHRRNARRVERAVVELQGLFIKVGQLISIMANFLPEAFRQELEGLQDQVPPRPYEDIEARLLEEWGGRRPEQIFAAFDRTPIASASIGQVHRARLHDGREVAVKVQYPDIEAIVRVDLHAMHRIFAVLGRFMPEWGFATIYREIREMILTELDYRKEAEAMNRIAATFTGRSDVQFPEVIGDHSTSRVLTTRFVSGV